MRAICALRQTADVHPSIHSLPLYPTFGKLDLNPAAFGREADYTLEKAPGHCRAKAQQHNQPFTLILRFGI